MKTLFSITGIILPAFQTRCWHKVNTKIKSLIWVMLIILTNMTVSAQPTTASVTLTGTTPGNVIGSCFITLPDSTGFSDVEVTLIDAINDSVRFARSYAFDQSTGLPPGISWQRSGRFLTLGVGTLPQRPGWKGRIRLKNTSGTWSSPLEFLFQ